MFILLVGSDSRADDYSVWLADSMRIFRIDFVDAGLAYLVFQGDLCLEIPRISSHSGTAHGKLDQAFWYGNPSLSYFDGSGQGTGLLARTRPNGDLERSRTQNVILQAFAAQLLSPASLPRLPGPLENLHRSVQTDLRAGDITALLCLAARLDPAAIQPLRFRDRLPIGRRIQELVPGCTISWQADLAQPREYVRHGDEGSWPIQGPAIQVAPTP